MRKKALWVGRFQPPTIAHYTTLECILSQWEQVTIGIVHATPPPVDLNHDWDEYLENPVANTLTQEKNPFTGEEVMDMWSAALTPSRYLDRVTLVTMPRVPYQNNFDLEFPKTEFDFVEVTADTSDSQFDSVRRETFERLLKRQIYYVSPSFKLHNTQIRRLIAAGECSWKDVLPSGCFEKFLEIEGPMRIIAPSHTR